MTCQIETDVRDNKSAGISVDITVIVCTHNRCQGLAKSLDSIAASIVPNSLDWEILVVDNNSSDDTAKIVHDVCNRYPRRFRYVFEPNEGLSNARNAGIKQAKGNIIVFTDDDLTVAPTWLGNLTAKLHDGRWAGAGGRILPATAFA